MTEEAHILICFLTVNLLTRDLALSFGSARAQNEHGLQQDALHLNLNSLLSFWVVHLSGSTACPVTDLHSNCHL